MFIWTAIDIDEYLIPQKEIVKELENKLSFELVNATSLPFHISLKITAKINDLYENEIRKDIIDIYNNIHPFVIELDKVEIIGSIVWIKAKENKSLIELHDALCHLFKDKYGIELDKFDYDFIYHTTLVLDNDIDKVLKAYNMLKDISLPKEVFARKFIIGSSKTGVLGTYKVDQEIVK